MDFASRVGTGRSRAGFTIIEVVAVVSATTVLLALLLPAVQQVRESVRRVQCGNHLRQMGLALHHYLDSHGVFPPSELHAPGDSGCDLWEVAVEDNLSHCTDYCSWTVLCLPFLDQSTLAAAYDDGREWSSRANRPAVSTPLAVFQCPSSPQQNRRDPVHVVGAAATDYGAVQRIEKRVFTDVFGVPAPAQAARAGVLAEYRANAVSSVTDGLSHTIMLAEGAGRPEPRVHRHPMTSEEFAAWSDDSVVESGDRFVVNRGTGWADPDSGFSIRGVQEDGVTPWGACFINGTNVGEVWSFHSGGAQVLYADGSVQFLSEDIDAWTFVSLCTRAGGEITDSF